MDPTIYPWPCRFGCTEPKAMRLSAARAAGQAGHTPRCLQVTVVQSLVNMTWLAGSREGFQGEQRAGCRACVCSILSRESDFPPTVGETVCRARRAGRAHSLESRDKGTRLCLLFLETHSLPACPWASMCAGQEEAATHCWPRELDRNAPWEVPQ